MCAYSTVYKGTEVEVDCSEFERGVTTTSDSSHSETTHRKIILHGSGLEDVLQAMPLHSCPTE